MDRHNIKNKNKKQKFYKCIMPNTTAGRKLHIPPTNYHLLAAQQKPYENEKYLSFLEKNQENGPLGEKLRDRKNKRTRQKKTRQEIGKGNQMTALRFQTGE